MISSSITNTLFSVSLFFSLLFLRNRFHEGNHQEKTSPLCVREEERHTTNPSQQARKKSEQGIIMFSSLSMRSALVGTSVPTTSTNSRGTRVHRSRRAQSARIPGTFFCVFFLLFSSLVRRRIFSEASIWVDRE